LYAQAGDEIIGTLRLQWGADAPFGEEDALRYDLDRFAAIARPNQMIIMSRFMVRAQFRGSDVALQLLRAMFMFYLDNGIQLAFLDCRPHLINLYQRLGYRTYTRAYNDPVAGLLVPLVLVVEDVAYLEQVHSPFLPQAREHAPRSDVPAHVTPLLLYPSSVHTAVSAGGQDNWSSLLQDDGDKVAIFQGLSGAEVHRLLERSHIIECSRGDRIISQGNTGHTVFIVLQGKVEVRRGERILTVETPGSVVGEVAFLLKSSRVADVVAATDDVRVLCLWHKTLEELIASEPRLAARLFYNLSRIIAVRFAAKMI
jgi:predicted GNAT family N-acyltransferase